MKFPSNVLPRSDRIGGLWVEMDVLHVSPWGQKDPPNPGLPQAKAALASVLGAGRGGGGWSCSAPWCSEAALARRPLLSLLSRISSGLPAPLGWKFWFFASV